jgi:hypothetical protein
VDLTVSFFVRDEKAPRKRRHVCTIQVHAQGGFELLEGEPDEDFLQELRTRRILAPPDGKRRVGPEDGLIWAQALPISYANPYFWAEPPRPCPSSAPEQRPGGERDGAQTWIGPDGRMMQRPPADPIYAEVYPIERNFRELVRQGGSDIIVGKGKRRRQEGRP